MALPPVITNLLLSNLLRQTQHQKETIKELSYRQYHSNEFNKLINNLLMINDKINDELDRITGDEEDAFDEIILYSDILKYIQDLCKYIEVSTMENIPPHLMYFTNFATNKFKKESSFILIPVYKTNFYFKELSVELQQKFRRCISGILDLYPIGGKKLSLLMYPFAYKNCIFTMSLLTHEIGHYVETENNVVNNLFGNIQIDPRYVEEILDEISRRRIGDTGRTLDHFLSRPALSVVINNEIVRIVNNWLKEIFCDLYAFKVIGPAYLISMIEFIFSLTKADISDEEHPPLELRLRVLLEEYKSSNYRHSLKNSKIDEFIKFVDHIDQVEKYFKEYEKDLSISSQENYAYITVEKLVPDIKRIVNDIVKELDVYYTPKQFINDVPILLKSIKSLVIPCELSLGEPADIISILNSYIIYQIENINEHYKELNEKLIIEKVKFEYNITELITKGVELCEIQKALKEKL